MNKFCFSGEGKGRIRLKNNKYLFRYESIFDTSKSNWQMSFNIPVHGEELIELDWADELRVNGKFYGRLLAQTRQMKNGNYQRMVLKKFLHFLVGVGQLSESKIEELSCSESSCDAFGKQWAWSQKGSNFVVTQKLNDRHILVAKGYETGDDYFGKLTFSVEDTENAQTGSPNLALNLFATSCDR